MYPPDSQINSAKLTPTMISTKLDKIYKVSTRAKTATSVKLQSLYGAAPEAVQSVPGVKYNAEVDYVIIIAVKPNAGE